MPAAPDRDSGRPARGRTGPPPHVVGAGAPGDQRRPAVDRAVPDPPGLVVTLLAGPQQRAAEAPAQPATRWTRVDRRCPDLACRRTHGPRVRGAAFRGRSRRRTAGSPAAAPPSQRSEASAARARSSQTRTSSASRRSAVSRRRPVSPVRSQAASRIRSRMAGTPGAVRRPGSASAASMRASPASARAVDDVEVSAERVGDQPDRRGLDPRAQPVELGDVPAKRGQVGQLERPAGRRSPARRRG